MKSISRFVMLAAIIASSLILASCGGGGGGSTAASTAPAQAGANGVLVSGFAAKGTVLNATVRATQIIDGQLGGIQRETALGPNGEFSLSMPKGLVHLEVVPQTNTTTQDEATGVAVSLPQDFKFRAAADLTDTTAPVVNLNITPFSEIGVALAAKSGGLTTANINKANSGIANILGFDHLSTKPIQSNNAAELATATANEKKLSLANAAISDMAATDSLGCGVKAAYGQSIDCTISKFGDQLQMSTAGSTPKVMLGDKGSQSFVVGLAKAAATGVTALKDITVDAAQDGLAFGQSAATYAKNMAVTTSNAVVDTLGEAIYRSQRQEAWADYQKTITDDRLITAANSFYTLAIISDLVYKNEWVNGANPGAKLDVRSRTTSGGYSYSASADLTVLNWAEYSINPQEATNSNLQWNAYYNSEVIVFAFRGTSSAVDISVDLIGTAVCQLNPLAQYAVALQQFDSLMANPKFNSFRGAKKIVLTGHSLGGGIASYIARKRPIVDWAVGFNPAPLCVATTAFAGESPFFHDPRIFRVSIKNEPISTWPILLITGFQTYFPGNPPLIYPNPFSAIANPFDGHIMSTVLFAMEAAKGLCTPALCPIPQSQTQVIQTPTGQATPLTVTGIQPSYMTSVAPYRPAISLSGSNLSAINQISWACTQPNGAACLGSPYVWAPSDWVGKVEIINDMSMKVYPRLLALGDATGTYNWTVTFSATNATPVSIPFSVTYQPQAATGVVVDGLSSNGFTAGTTNILTTTNPVTASLTVSGKNLGTAERIEWRWSGAATGSATWMRSDPAWNSKVTLTADGKLILSPTVVEANPNWSGTAIWTGTLIDAAGASQNITFSVTYQPPIAPVVNGFADNYSTSATPTAGVPYQPSINLTGSGFNSVTQISWTCTKPDGTSCGAITPWKSTDANWSSKFVRTSDTAASISPVLLTTGDAAGTYTWTATFSGAGVTTTKMFRVNYTPTASLSNDYPYQSSPPCPVSTPNNLCPASTVDPWGFFFRECTSFVAYRLNRDAGTTFFTNQIASGTWGNATNWASRARALGYQVDTSPSVGAIAWFAVGHVAYVESINQAAGTVTISEYNYYINSNPHTFSTRTLPLSAVGQFIHINASSPTPAAQTPGISSLSITSVPADSTARTLTVYGSNFAAGNVVKYRWLNPAGSSTATASVSSASQLSASFNPGNVADTIYVKVCQSSTSTICSGELAISVTALATAPDLQVLSGAVSPSTVSAGGTVSASWTISNQGTGTANASTTVVRINQSTTSAAGSNLASISTNSLASGGSQAQNANLTAPTTPGTYYVWVITDNASTAGQSASAAANDLVRIGSFTVATAVTAPAAQSLAATSITSTTAQMNGSINPNGLSTSAYFEYGTTTNYGSTTTPGTFSGTSVISIQSGWAGLAPNTTYHYRTVATNSGGTSRGGDIAFTTPVTPLVVNGLGSSYSGVGAAMPYKPPISLTGSGLSSVTQISWSCAMPGGAACAGSPYIWTAANWGGKFALYSDTSASASPTLLVASDPVGTYNWSVTFSGEGQSVTKVFAVIK